MRRKDWAGCGGRARPKISRDFETSSLSLDLCGGLEERVDSGRISKVFQLVSGAVFRVVCVSLIICTPARTVARWSAKTRDGELKSFRTYRLAVSIPGDLCALSRRRAGSLREINAAERLGRMGWMRGVARP